MILFAITRDFLKRNSLGTLAVKRKSHQPFCICREKKNRPLKNPLKELVVVHTHKDFLADIQGDCNLYQVYVIMSVFTIPGHVN